MGCHLRQARTYACVTDRQMDRETDEKEKIPLGQLAYVDNKEME